MSKYLLVAVAATLAAPAFAQSQPTSTDKAAQVAAIVDGEFPSYDKDSDGSLSAAEFAAWMVALKAIADPATKADSAEARTWIGQAFASADTDHDKAVSKAELNGFLAQGG